jgi:hypothetical protein
VAGDLEVVGGIAVGGAQGEVERNPVALGVFVVEPALADLGAEGSVFVGKGPRALGALLDKLLAGIGVGGRVVGRLTELDRGVDRLARGMPAAGRDLERDRLGFPNEVKVGQLFGIERRGAIIGVGQRWILGGDAGGVDRRPQDGGTDEDGCQPCAGAMPATPVRCRAVDGNHVSHPRCGDRTIACLGTLQIPLEKRQSVPSGHGRVSGIPLQG